MEQIAHQFIEAIKTIAEKPQNFENLRKWKYKAEPGQFVPALLLGGDND